VAISPTILVKPEGDEGEIPYTFTVTRTGNVSQAATVTYTVSDFGDNSATDEDFVSSRLGEVTFTAGETSTTLELKVKGDVTFESDESFIVTLSAQSLSSSTQVDSSGSKTIGVIQNDDIANLVFKPISASVQEGTVSQNFLSYEIVRNGDNAQALEVNFLITGVSIGVFDTSQITLAETLAGLTGTVTIVAGESRAVLSLPIQLNALAQADRTFKVSVVAAGFTDPAPIDSTILDDDSGITLSQTSNLTTEGDVDNEHEYVFTVSRSGTNLAPTNVMWSVSGLGDNAARGDDFLEGVLPVGVVAFNEGQTEATIVIKLAGDIVVESNEVYRLSLLSSSDSTQRVLVSSVDATIINDDIASDTAELIQTGAGSELIEAGAGDDRIQTGGGADLVFAGTGNDIVYGQGGADAIYGGIGDDVFWLNADNIVHLKAMEGQATTFIDGGLGFDVLALDGSDMEINLSDLVNQGNVRSIEKIDISGTGANQLTLALEGFATIDPDQEGVRRLFVDRDADDTVVISDINSWNQVDDVNGYVVWQQANFLLMIELALPLPVLP
jgi:Ca2+-binding RTX toxin-like protein